MDVENIDTSPVEDTSETGENLDNTNSAAREELDQPTSSTALVIEGGLDIPIPRMVPIRQKFPGPEIKDVAAEIKQLFWGDGRMREIKKGSRIAVTAGSRGIHSIDKITHAVVKGLQALGAKPFIVTAMGSHGGATAEGQRKVLAE